MFDPSQQPTFNYLNECGITEPIQFGPNVDPEETDWSKWLCIYPQYINAQKTIGEGRRIPKSKAVDDPTPAEMAQICAHLKIPYIIEYNHSYPRDWMTPGRLRVELKCIQTDASSDSSREATGVSCNGHIVNKKQLMLSMGELIPKLKSRCTPMASSSSRSGAASHPKKKK